MMNRFLWILFGATVTFTSAVSGLVLAPHIQLGKMEAGPILPGDEGEYPKKRTELEELGKQVYQKNGCIYCHSQQVRSIHFGNNADIARGWGVRRSVARDYLHDRPILLGTMRTGPDLANVGPRWSPDWHHKHLYNPRMMVPGSIMPPFQFLYKIQERGASPDPKALALYPPWRDGLKDNQEVIPTEEAEALVAYLMSLDQTADLPEARE
ncbi:MAG: cbb3-type cytochrome c oxidase subunit II [Zavarzinella sp.]